MRTAYRVVAKCVPNIHDSGIYDVRIPGMRNQEAKVSLVPMLIGVKLRLAFFG